MITVLSREFFSQISNGEDFSTSTSDYSTNLIGSVMERIRARITLRLTVVSSASASEEFTVDDTAKTITRTTTFWTDEGWNIGDTFATDGDLGFEGTVIALDDFTLTYDLAGGTDTPGAYDGLNLYLTSDYLGAVWQYNLTENGDTTNDYVNKVDGSDQLYTLAAMSGTFAAMNAAPGAKSWRTGDARIRRDSFADGVAEYTIEQDFTILPYYLEQYADELDAGILPDDFFDGTLSLKFIFGLSLRRVLSDPNAENTYTETDQLGSVGWFDENYNGYQNDFTLQDITYTDTATGDAVTGLQIDRKTTVSGTILSDGLFNGSSKVGVYHSAALDPDDYAANTTLYDPLWLYDNAVKSIGNYPSLTGIIKRVLLTNVDTDTITFEFDVEYNTSQQAQLSDGQRYILGIQTQGDFTRPASNMVIMLADFGAYTKSADVSGLLTFDSMQVLFHPQAESDIGYSNVRGWIEDGFLLKLLFSLDIEIPARLRQIVFKIIAKSTSGNEFTIQSYAFDLSSGLLQPVGGGLFKQAFNLDTTRGFPLATGDFFNRVRLAEYIDESGYRYGEWTQDTLSKAIAFDSEFVDTYALVVDDFGGTGVSISAQSDTGFTNDAGGTSTDPGYSYFAIDEDAEINGIRGGEETLLAGTNTITFDTLGTDEFTVIIFGSGFNASGIVASQTNTSFQITDCAPGSVITWFAVRNSGFADIRAGNTTLSAGNNTVNLSSSLGGTDYTLFIFDLQNTGNLSGRVKAAGSFDVEAGIGTDINYVAILNP